MGRARSPASFPPKGSRDIMPGPMTADQLIKSLRLAPHPEGGFFRETYRAAGTIAGNALPNGFAGDRVFSTSIYYLLQGRQVSVLHRIRSDELWHFHMGDAMEVIDITRDGALTTTVLGHDVADGNTLQSVVPAGRWFGARLARPAKDAFALMGCTVAPGFDFADFEIAHRDTLLNAFPQHTAIIKAMTRPEQMTSPAEKRTGRDSNPR